MSEVPLHHQPSERDQIVFLRPWICPGARWNPAACGNEIYYAQRSCSVELKHFAVTSLEFDRLKLNSVSRMRVQGEGGSLYATPVTHGRWVAQRRLLTHPRCAGAGCGGGGGGGLRRGSGPLHFILIPCHFVCPKSIQP